VVWSPDNKWLAYTKQLHSQLRAAFVYSLDTRKCTQVTDGLSDVLYPNLDKNGKYLYFTASTDVGLSIGWGDLTSYDHPVTCSARVVVLRKDLPSPIAPESDDEKSEDAKKAKSRSGAGSASKRLCDGGRKEIRRPTDVTLHEGLGLVRLTRRTASFPWAKS
jgi:tricorn protease